MLFTEFYIGLFFIPLLHLLMPSVAAIKEKISYNFSSIGKHKEQSSCTSTDILNSISVHSVT